MQHFIMAKDDYKRDVNLVPAYIRDCATYLQLDTGIDFDECVDYVRTQVGPGGPLEIKSPEIMCLSKDTPGNRVQRTMPWDQYVGEAVQAGDIISPTLAVYANPLRHESILGKYVGGNLTKRQVSKHEMFTAQSEADIYKLNGDMEKYKQFSALAGQKDAEQSSTKVKNNSLSGAHAAQHTPLYNKSSHSTLTSSCRSATSYGNASNEKFLYGNRHYWSAELVKANIISIINTADLGKIANALSKYGIVYPTMEQTMACITRSSDLYWRDMIEGESIRALVGRLSPVQRAAVVYVGDFYHLAEYNRDFCHHFLDQLSSKATVPLSVEEASQYIGAMDDDLKAFVSMLCEKELYGTNLKKLKVENPEGYGIMGATAKAIPEVLDQYAEMIQALWVTNCMPASIAALPTIIRRCAIASDTDSTIFTTQHWTKWFVGTLDFSPKSRAISSTMVYLASQAIRHVLAKLSVNMGVTRENLHKLAMKNEYAFPVFALTGRAKHYYANMSAREGNVYVEFKKEIKGVALRNSNVPKHVNDKAHGLIDEIMDTIYKGNKLSLTKIQKTIGAMEDSIRNSIMNGKYDYMTRMQIRDVSSYTKPESSVFVYYDMWEKVFAPKYGHAEAPPYGAIKIAMNTEKPAKLKAWLASIEDPALAERMIKWLEANNKKHFTALYLPESILSTTGIPKEVIIGVNIRKLIFATMEPFYLILESLNIHMKNKWLTRLVSDKVELIMSTPNEDTTELVIEPEEAQEDPFAGAYASLDVDGSSELDWFDEDAEEDEEEEEEA